MILIDPNIELVARTPKIAELVKSCARGELHFDDLCERVADMGYKTTSLYEMVREAEKLL